MKNTAIFCRYVIGVLSLCMLMLVGCSSKINTISTASLSQETVLSISAENPYFYKSGTQNLVYKGSLMFEDIIEKDVSLSIIETAVLSHGKLYKLLLEPIPGVPDNRLNLGCFLVQQEKIYKISDENLSLVTKTESLPEDSVIVCQDKEIKDSLEADVPGIHQHLDINGDKREYHKYNNNVETGYYESFIWEKNKGLVSYTSGFGAERDSIELQLTAEN